MSDKWCSNTTIVCIDRFKHKWSFWTSPHSVWLIDTLTRSRRNLSKRGESLDLQIPHSRSKAKEVPTYQTRDRAKMATLRTTSPGRNTRRVLRSRIRTHENGVNTIKSLGTRLKNVTPSSHSWSNWRLPSQRSIMIVNQILKEGSGLLLFNLVPLSLPPKSNQVNQKTRGRGTPLL